MRLTRTLAASAALLALSLGSASAQEVEKLGLAVADLQANFFNQIKQSVEAKAAEEGIEVITVDAKGDGPTQVNQIQDLLTQNIDALIYIPAGAAAAPQVDVDQERRRLVIVQHQVGHQRVDQVGIETIVRCQDCYSNYHYWFKQEACRVAVRVVIYRP